MIGDDEKKWFDKLLRDTAWPSPSSDLSERVIRRMEQAEERRITMPGILARAPLISRPALLTMVMVTIFCLGSISHGFIYGTGQASANTVTSYYTGTGMYLFRRFGS